MDDSLLRERFRPPIDLLRERREAPPAPASPEADRDVSGEEPERFDPDRGYKACGRACNRMVPGLRIILKDGEECGCLYAHLDTRRPNGCAFLPSAPGKGNVIRLRFAGAESSFTVTLEGRRLRRVWELIMGHLTPWVSEYPADVDTLGPGEPVITAITFTGEGE